MSNWAAFTARAEVLGASVLRVRSEDGATTLLSEAASRYACTQSVVTRYPRVADQSVADEQSEVVAAAAFAVAETGSVALDEPAGDRGRCFLADRLWLLVPEQALVDNLDVALQQIHALIRNGAGHPLLMSGPSRTADIERVLTIGVHGPRALVIVVVDS